MNAERVYPGLEVTVNGYNPDAGCNQRRHGKAVSFVNSDPNRWWIKYKDDGSMDAAHVDNMEPAEITEIEILL